MSSFGRGTGDVGETFGDLLRSLRRSAGLTQEALAERASMSAQAVGALERGHRRYPYRDTVDRLADALALPDDVRTRLVAATKRPRAQAPVPAPAPVPVSARAARQLPAGPARFIGRTAEVDALVDALREPAGVMVHVVAGMGGIGKTSFAVHVGHLVADHFPDGQLYVDLRGTGPGDPLTAIDAMSRILRAVGVSTSETPATADEAASWYRSGLAGRRLLLVLDNASGPAQVAPLLPGTAGCAAIVTTRTVMGSLTSARHLSLDVMSEAEALRLLTTAAGPARVTAEPADAVAVTRLCGRHPLAVHVAGARLAARPDWPMSHLARRLAAEHSRLDELDIADLGVRASFAVSLDQLAARDRRAADAYLLLGVVDCPDFTVTLGARLLDLPERDAERILEQLVDLQLLQAPMPDRYRMHDLLRVFVRERAAALDDTDRAAAVARVLDLFAAAMWRGALLLWTSGFRPLLAEESWTAAAPDFADSADAFAWLDEHRPHIAVAAEEAARCPGVPRHLLTRLALGGAPFYLTRGYGGDLAAICELALHAESDRLTAAVLGMDLGLAMAERTPGSGTEALTRMRDSLTVFEQIGTDEHVATCLTNLTHVCLVTEQLDAGVEYGERALLVCRTMNAPIGAAMALLNLGHLHGMAGRHSRALEMLDKSVTMFEELGDPHRAAAGLRSAAGRGGPEAHPGPRWDRCVEVPGSAPRSVTRQTRQRRSTNSAGPISTSVSTTRPSRRSPTRCGSRGSTACTSGS